MGGKPKICLGTYTGNVTHASMHVNVAHMVEDLVRVGMYDSVGPIHIRSSRIDANRNKMIHLFLTKSTADFLFIIDEDMVHPALMPRVLAERDKPIITGLYFRRDYKGFDRSDYAPVIYRCMGKRRGERDGYGEYEDYCYDPMTLEVMQFLDAVEAPALDVPLYIQNPDGTPLQAGPKADPLIRIDGFGFGCLLLRRDALEQMEPPYLLDRAGLNGDLTFCRQAQEKGIEAWCDMSVIASHLHEWEIGVRTFGGYMNAVYEKVQSQRQREVSRV